MSDDWIKELLAKNQQQSSNWRRGKKINKTCQWVENATLPRGCTGIVRQTDTIYCEFHCMMWDERETNLAVELREVEKERKRRS